LSPYKGFFPPFPLSSLSLSWRLFFFSQTLQYSALIARHLGLIYPLQNIRLVSSGILTSSVRDPTRSPLFSNSRLRLHLSNLREKTTSLRRIVLHARLAQDVTSTFRLPTLPSWPEQPPPTAWPPASSLFHVSPYPSPPFGTPRSFSYS